MKITITLGSAASQNVAAGIGPMLILETMYGMRQTPVLAAAVDLNLFTQLGRDDGSAESLAERTGYSGSGYGANSVCMESASSQILRRFGSSKPPFRICIRDSSEQRS